MGGTATELRVSLCARLRARRVEIEQETLTRIFAISDPSEVSEPAYVEGLRVALSAALDYGLAGIEAGERHPPKVPAILFAQARLAARNEVSLDTVLRRYFAGYALFGDFLIEEAEAERLGAAELKRVLRAHATTFDRLLAAVSEEHGRETNERPERSQRRLAECVQGLLVGELIDTAEIAYDLEVHHLGIVAAGPGATQAIRALAESSDCRLLYVSPDERNVWAWFGTRRESDPHQIAALAEGHLPPHAALAFGEPAQGLPGWRLTHRQAAAALPIAQRGARRIVHYAEVALLACALRDDLLFTSLRQLYLDPLDAEPEGGHHARETLRAYLAAERNVSSAAAALGLNRRTVANRLRAIEERFGRPLEAVATEVDAALRLERLSGTPLAARAD